MATDKAKRPFNEWTAEEVYEIQCQFLHNDDAVLARVHGVSEDIIRQALATPIAFREGEEHEEWDYMPYFA